MSKLTQNKNGSLSYEKDDPIPIPKKKAGRKPTYIHKCSEKNTIIQLLENNRKLNLIIGGNGDPEKGLAFIAKSNIQAIAVIKEDITYIKNKLSATITAATTAASSLEQYKLEVKNFELGKESVESEIEKDEERKNVARSLALTQRRDLWYKIFTSAGLIVTIIGLAIAIYFGVRNDKIPAQLEATKEEINTKIEQGDGVSKVTRGGYVKYNDQGMSDSIKLY